MRVFFTNLGCKLNQAELEGLARRMRADGHDIVASLDGADLHIVNSCTVTHVAARTSRKAARLGSRSVSSPRTVLTGCYATGSPAEAADLAGVDLVIPNAEKDRLIERLYERFPDWRPAAPAPQLPVPYVPIEFGNARGLVKIEDGCNMRCSFCVIPLTRGSQRSRDPDELVAEVRAQVAGGHRELVVTGVQISSYRWGRTRLVDLIRRLLDETEIERLRLTSIAPWDVQPGLFDLLQSGRICRHIHLSLQSGCDRTLEAMRRPYTTTQFAGLVDLLHQTVSELAITTDVIVGFPGETESDFAASLEFVEAMQFARIHAFPFSPRDGTDAAERRDQVRDTERRARMGRMLEVAERSKETFQRHRLGTVVPVLWETRTDEGWIGTSDNYLKVATRWAGAIERSITPTHLTTLEDGELRGRPVTPLGDRAPNAERRPEPIDAVATG